ncbi:IS21 family transposase [Streptomyces anulatus]|uniref:IS21 family transposase n=1 Tax=Streptomyces anulatus TaxID=1892 RepID=UPI000B058533
MSLREIAKETGLNRRTVGKYLKDPASLARPKREAADQRPRRVVDEVAPLIDAVLRSEIVLEGRVIHERLAQEHGVTINYQRVKLYLQEARPRIAEERGISPGELAGLHRRFEVVPGAQAQVDWGDEGKVLAHVGIPKVHSFHMTLSYSRVPFCCFTTSQDLATLFDCHRQAFAHFGGVPMGIVYDRTKTVARRHVAPGEAVPLHPEAVAFAGHYDFDIDVLAAYRPQGKDRVERQVGIVRPLRVMLCQIERGTVDDIPVRPRLVGTAVARHKGPEFGAVQVHSHPVGQRLLQAWHRVVFDEVGPGAVDENLGAPQGGVGAHEPSAAVTIPSPRVAVPAVEEGEEPDGERVVQAVARVVDLRDEREVVGTAVAQGPGLALLHRRKPAEPGGDDLPCHVGPRRNGRRDGLPSAVSTHACLGRAGGRGRAPTRCASASAAAATA